MILMIDNEIKIQGRPEECIDFLKRYKEEFPKDNPITNIFETPEISPSDYNDWLHTHHSNPVPGVKYTADSCEDCLYYQQTKGKDSIYIVGDTPCTWCPKMRPTCTSSVLTAPLDIN